jgi:hypothetical protein
MVEVRLVDGSWGLLDLGIPRSRIWAEVLASLRDTSQPAYLEIEPDTHVITELLMPIASQVQKITETADGDLQVDLVRSHARHFLRRSRPDFPTLRAALEKAQGDERQVLITETDDDHSIFDVRTGSKG